MMFAFSELVMIASLIAEKNETEISAPLIVYSYKFKFFIIFFVRFSIKLDVKGKV